MARTAQQLHKEWKQAHERLAATKEAGNEFDEEEAQMLCDRLDVARGCLTSRIGKPCALCSEDIEREEDAVIGYDPMEPLSGPIVVHAACAEDQGM